MFSRFFIDRPIFASVLSIVITLAGALAVFTLPVAQYPEITPPTVEVSAIFPGANSQVVADTVASPIEEKVNGVEDMMYMASQCTNDGGYKLTITFKLGVDLNMAQVLVQNRVNLAQPLLPDLVKRRGITVKKKAPNVLMIVNLYSPDGTRDNLYLSNYATIQLRDELARLAGVGDIDYLGQRDYSMRVWLDPDKMASLEISSDHIVKAIEQQNVQVAAGQIGQPPAPTGQVFQYTMGTQGRLGEAEQFADMVIKTGDEGRMVRLRDVANIELGALGYDQTCWLDGKASVALSIYQLPGTNALDTAAAVRAKMEEMKTRFPAGLDYAIVYDTTPFIQESIHEVFKTLRDAVLLVGFVVLLFLQNWRSAIIPLIAVPVAIVGTFAVMAALGFSLNNLTLFGLVLAIGIVVDDAIVVVEAVEHHIERGLTPYDASVKAMQEVSGPVIAVGLVLAAVFVPCAFIGGIVGQFFRQFALTIAVSTVLSAFNSLTLSPALSALLLKPHGKTGRNDVLPPLGYSLIACWIGYETVLPYLGLGVENLLMLFPEETRIWAREYEDVVWWISLAVMFLGLGGLAWLASFPLNWIVGKVFRAFNQAFEFGTGIYRRLVGFTLRIAVLLLLVYGGLLAVTAWTFTQTPTGFIPHQDMGYLVLNLQLPDASSAERTRTVMRQAEAIARQIPGVKHTVAISGQSFVLGATAPNFGGMYVMLDDFPNRRSHELSSDAIARKLESQLKLAVADGTIHVFGAPPLSGLSTAGGFKIMIEDRKNSGPEFLEEISRKIIEAGEDSRELEGLFTSFRAQTPWLYLDIDRTAAKTMGVSMGDVFQSLQVNFGSLYVNDFNRFGRTWQVTIQAAPAFRNEIDDLKRLRIQNDQGLMVPLASIATVRDTMGPVLIQRYNLFLAAAINGNPTPGVSSGRAIDALEEVVATKLDAGMRYEWTELALLQLQTGDTGFWIFVLAVVLVFLVLAAQYESWALPLAVILVVPMCLLCSNVGVLAAEMDINIFTQIGFVVLVGLSCKNAILIVEFAKARREAGVNRTNATLEACELRLRPIVMTSLAFILGVVPLVLAEGAGAEMRRTLGTAVFAGMLGVTLFGLFLTPIFYFVVQWFADRWTVQRPTNTTSS